MAKKTTGKLYAAGARGFWYIRQFEGKDIRTRLLDPDGKPITGEKETQPQPTGFLHGFTKPTRPNNSEP